MALRIHLLSILIFTSLSLSAQSSHCSNIDFEDGNLSGWTSGGDVTMVNADQTDEYGNFNLSLSGNYAVKLGQKTLPVYQEPFKSNITRTINVTNDNKFLIYGYAVVFLGYPHTNDIASYVKLSVLDADNNILPCASYTAYAQQQGGDGFFESDKEPEANLANECCFEIYYSPWTRNIIDLSAYVGQTVTMELSSDWCYYEVDWGYAYIDLYCADDLIKEYYDCVSGKNILSTIEGMPSYTWTGPGIVSGQSTRSVEINSPGIYTVFIPNSNESCSDITVSIDANLAENTSTLESEITAQNGCIGELLLFQNTSTTDGYLIHSEWLFGDGDTSSLFAPAHSYGESGIYTVQLIAEDTYHCLDTAITTVTISDVSADLGPDLLFCEDFSVDIAPKLLPAGTTTLWNNGSTGEFLTVTEADTITLQLDYQGCITEDTLVIKRVSSSLEFVPNVITADGDGINDLFEVQSIGLESTVLRIFNRWGEVLFETPDLTDSWDGRDAKGNDVPEGVYFYNITYNNQCQDQLLREHGAVTVVRNN